MSESIRGKALVASPFLQDPNFLRTVVYMLNHDSAMALGLVLNRPTSTSIAELVRSHDGREILCDEPVYYGGPVSDALMILQSMSNSKGERCVFFMASETQNVIDLCVEQIEGEPSQVKAMLQQFGEGDFSDEDLVLDGFRVFQGCSSWGPGQLDAEMETGSWLVWPVGPDEIFSASEPLWEEAVKEIGREVLSAGIAPERIPADPAVN